eukprot:7259045-Prorocentrum_lima.AAC.1
MEGSPDDIPVSRLRGIFRLTWLAGSGRAQVQEKYKKKNYWIRNMRHNASCHFRRAITAKC